MRSLTLTRFGIFLLLLAPLVSWAPLFFGYVSAKVFWIFAVIELTVASYLWLIYWHPSFRPRWTWQMSVLAGYVLVIGLSTVFGVYPMNSFWSGFERNEGLLMWIHLAALFPILLSVFQTEKRWLQLATGSCTVAIMVSVLFFLMKFSLYTPAISDNGGSTLGNSSYLGVYLLFHMFFAGFLALRGQERWTRAFGVASLALFLFTLVSTDARAATLSFFGGAALFGALLLVTGEGAKRAGKKRAGWIALAFLAAGFLFTVTSFLSPEGVIREYFVSQATGSRYVIWDIAWKAILDRPLLGWGPENFHQAFLQYYDPCLGNAYCGGNTLFDRPHNILLDSLVHTGVLGLLGYAALLLAVVAGGWLAVRRRGYDRRVAVLLTSLLAAYFVQNLLFFDLFLTLLFIVILLAFTTAASSDTFVERELIPEKETPALSMLPVLGTVLLPLALFFFVVQPTRAGLAVFEAMESRKSTERFTALQTALWTTPFGRDVRVEYLGFSMAKLLWSYHPERNKDDLARVDSYLRTEAQTVEIALRETILRAPNNLRGSLYLTELLATQGRLFDPAKYQEAFEAVEKAMEKTPKSPRLHWIKAALFLEIGDENQARASARTAQELNSDAPSSLWKQFLFATYVGDETMRKEATETLQASHPRYARLIPEVLDYDLSVKKYAIFRELYSE